MTIATFVTGALLLILGSGVFALHNEAARQKALKALRNRAADGILMLVAAAWFLWIVSNLGEADFGDYKVPLFVAFAGISLGAWFYVKDFLGVRAVSVLWLLVSWHLLGAAFGHYEAPARLFAVGALYAGVVLSLFFGTLPYRARDLAEWLCAHGTVAKIAGTAIALYGAWLCMVPYLFYPAK